VVGTRASTTLDIEWTDSPLLDMTTFQRYEVSVREEGGSFGAPVTVSSLGRSGVGAMSALRRTASFSGLDAGVRHEVRIVTVSSARPAAHVDNTAVALVMPLSVPSAPRDLAVEGAGAAGATVSWRVPLENGGSPITEYVVTTSSGSCVPATQTSTRCALTGLTAGQTVTVGVTARNLRGDSLGVTTVYSVPTTPGAPTITSVNLSQTTASLSWQAPSVNGGRPVTSYTAIATASGTEVGRCTTAGTTCEIAGLQPGTSHVFTVRAHNSVGTGTASPAYTATTASVPSTPVAAAPRAPTASPVLALPPPPARVITAAACSGRTRISAVRSATGTQVPVNEAIISVMTRSGRLLARIRVQVDSTSPQVSVTVPYSARQVKVAVQFANDYGISEGGPVGVNVIEARTLEAPATVNQVKVVGTEVGAQAYFTAGSATLTRAGKTALAKAATEAKLRGGLVYVSGFATTSEVRSVWLVNSLARKRAENAAKYLSSLGVRQWI